MNESFRVKDSTIDNEKAERVQQTKECIRHFQHVYQQLLRIRLKLQPTIMKAISLPQYYVYKLFTDQAMKKKLKGCHTVDNYNNINNNSKDNYKSVDVKQVKTKYE